MPTNTEAPPVSTSSSKTGLLAFTEAFNPVFKSLGPADKWALLDLLRRHFSGRPDASFPTTRHLLEDIASYATDVQRAKRIVAMILTVAELLDAAGNKTEYVEIRQFLDNRAEALDGIVPRPDRKAQ